MIFRAFVLCLVAGAYAQTDTRRFIIPDPSLNKLVDCTGYDFYLVDQQNGTTFIDRTFYTWQNTRMACAPGTLFSIDPRYCNCDTHFTLPYLLRNERCVTISGNMQTDKNFNIVQRGDLTQYPMFVGGYDAFVPNVDQCFASNVNEFRFVDFLKGSSLARESMSLTIGFSIPIQNQQIGRQYTIAGSGPCSGEPTTQSSFTITYVTGNPNQGLNHRITVDLRMSDKFRQNGPESAGTITCDISNSVTAVNQNRAPHNWDSSDPTNELSLSLNLGAAGSAVISLTNFDMRQNGVPGGGFCQNPTVNIPSGRGRNRFQISPRNCAMFVGKAPTDSFMCIYGLSMVRDC